MKNKNLLFLAFTLLTAAFSFGQNPSGPDSSWQDPHRLIRIVDVEPSGSGAIITLDFDELTQLPPDNNGPASAPTNVDAMYCLNTVSYTDSVIDLQGNTDLLEAADFNCAGEWYAYDDLGKAIFVDEYEYTVVNVLALTSHGQSYVYNRLFLRPDIELLDADISASDFTDKLLDNNADTKAFALQGDIDFAGNELLCKTEGISYLYLYGNGHALTNVEIETTIGYGGLGFIKYINSDSYISSLGIQNAYINAPSSSFVGGLVGIVENSLLEHVYYVGSSIHTYQYTGGLVGQMTNSTIRSSFTDVVLEGYDYIAGLVSKAESGTKIINSYSLGEVISTGDYTAGLISYLNDNSLILNSYSKSDVTGFIYTGGLVGFVDDNSVIDGSFASGEINSTDDYTGGLAGFLDNESEILNSYASGDVTTTLGLYIGGLVGYLTNESEILNSHATGNVTSVDGGAAGGIAGYVVFGSILNNTYATGNVSAPGGVFVGGLACLVSSEAEIHNSYATGDVTGISSLGGLVGELLGASIENSYSTGNIYGTGHSLGGLVGHSDASTIFNAYATGNVEGDERVGSLIGFFHIESLVENSYALGTASGNEDVGGFIGYISSNSTTLWSYCLQESPNVPTGLTQLTMEEFGEEESFYNWNFNSVWYISHSAGRPKFGFNFGGGSGQTANDPYIIKSLTDLEVLSYRLERGRDFENKYFLQTSDIDASATQTWNSGAGFIPIGNIDFPFNANYDGDSHSISNLYINRPTSNNTGLFGYASAASITRLGLENISVSGQDYTGGLVGTNYNSEISECYTTGKVSGTNKVGGLVGLNDASSTISNSFSTGPVSSSSNDAGGLVGNNDNSTISNSFATAAVNGSEKVGGLVGNNTSSNTQNCYATGTVNGTTWTGGLCGVNLQGTLTNNYYDTQTTQMGDVGCGYSTGTIANLSGLSTEDFKTNAFTGFNFGNTTYMPWTANANGRPFLYYQYAAVSNGTDSNNTFWGYALSKGTAIIETGLRYALLSDLEWSDQAVKTSEGALWHTITGLQTGSEYLAHVYAKDVAGNYYYGDMINFVAELAQTPQPIMLNPENNATSVELTNVVAVDFDIPIIVGDLSGISINPDPGNVASVFAGQKITIAHNDFDANTLYTVSVPTGAVYHGEAPNEEFSWSFTTKSYIGIEEAGDKEDEINIYPNPSTGIFNIRVKDLTGFQNLLGLTTNWEITNTHSSIIATGNEKCSEFSVKLTSHPKGIYFLKISREGKQFVRKLVLE